MKIIYTAGIGGGPGAGKSILGGYLVNQLTDAGYRAYFVPEAASILIAGGATPGSVAFQILVFKKILELERHALEQAEADSYDGPIFIIFDRTLFDGGGYITTEEFLQLIAEFGMTIEDLCARYDAILYLETAAKGAPGFYGKQNNAVRYEDLPGAIATCDRTFAAYQPHPNVKVTSNNGGTFSQKLFSGYQNFCLSFQLPVPLSDNLAKRFYLKSFDIRMLEQLNISYSAVHVEQIYLDTVASAHKPRRIRRKVHNGTETFFYTRERQTGVDDYTQVEKIITHEEYERLRKELNHDLKVIYKTRYSFDYEGLLYEIDIFENPIYLSDGLRGVGKLKITPTQQQKKVSILNFFNLYISRELEPKELTDYMIACQK